MRREQRIRGAAQGIIRSKRLIREDIHGGAADALLVESLRQSGLRPLYPPLSLQGLGIKNPPGSPAASTQAGG